jgi:hypothetical protein
MKRIPTLFAAIILLHFTAIAQWSKLGTGPSGLNISGEGIYTVCSDNHNNIYAAGWLFDTAFHSVVGKWNGSSWSRLGEGSIVIDSVVQINRIVADTSGNLYAACSVGGGAPAYVAKWNGTSWSKLGGGGLNAHGDVISVALDRYGNVYAAGVFSDTISDTIISTYVAKWDGSSWNELGTGVHALKGNGAINSVFVDSSGNVYAAGSFTDSATASGGYLRVAKWDGTDWTYVGGGIRHAYANDFQIFTIMPDAAGNIYAAGTLGAHVMKWDGVMWTALGPSSDSVLNYNVSDLCLDPSGNVYVAGLLRHTGAYDAFVAKWNGSVWAELGGSGSLGANGDVISVCSDGNGNIYAGGVFTDTSVTVMYDTTVLHPYYVAKYPNPATAFTPPLAESGESPMIYPNPARDMLTVDPRNGVVLKIRILDAAGHVLFSRECSGSQLETINTSGLASGIYFVTLQTPQQMIARKIMIAK